MIICPGCQFELSKTNKSLSCRLCGYTAKINEDGVIFFHPEKLDNHYDYYPDGSLDTISKIEKKHFWFRFRRFVILHTFHKYVFKNNAILELGAGTGYIGNSLMQECYSNYFACDISNESIKILTSNRFAGIYQFNILNQPFINHFDVVCAFDVLEHIDDDNLVIKNINRILHKNGICILTVPAHSFLWSNFDVASGHKRRYDHKRLENIFSLNGFSVISIKYFFVAILPFLLLRKILLGIRNNVVNVNSLIFFRNNFLNNILYLFFQLEFYFINFIKIPFGGSLIVVARKN